jgi:glycosyltransferase involved in cell wall biosynthesis
MPPALKGIFLTNPDDLNAAIPGGVQICSNEFLSIIRNAGVDLSIFEVGISQKKTYRLLRKLRLDAYHLYDVDAYEGPLCREIEKQGATYVFINKSELLKFSALIRKKFGTRVQVVIMSHGNETYDLLHEYSGEFSRITGFTRIRELLRMGLNLYAESYYRIRYVDLVCAMSNEETAVEKWLGSRHVLFLPRLVEERAIQWVPNLHYVGYVGTLNHTPNFIALEKTLTEIEKQKEPTLRFRLVGGPTELGRQLADRYAFVDYLGKLSDAELEEEVQQWAFFLNPIYWYSRGASMKLAKAIGWGLPIVTTQAGRRGYSWKNGSLLETPDDAPAFVKGLLLGMANGQQIDYWQAQTLRVRESSPGLLELSHALRNRL